jgi:DNA end-binding protein Ku
MATKKKQTRSKRKKERPRTLPFHAFWSGSLSFGLVNVPVLLFPASRYSGVRLRLLSPEGAALERRFYCPREGKELSRDEIVRGYELDDGSYITVSDTELEAAEPRKTREIALREFVEFSEVPPSLLERGYYLTPLTEQTKAYRLLAEAMERTKRAGIATFVMRDREYLVAIFAEAGILCAETLRFQDEIRDPATIGLPEQVSVPRQRVAAFERSISALSAAAVSRDDLGDTDTRKLREIIARKQRAGRDIVRTNEEPEEDEAAAGADVDLLEAIRRSLRDAGKRRGPSRAGAKRPRNQRRHGSRANS